MDTFNPEIYQAPTELTSIEILSKLPEHYLTNPTSSNMFALGAIYVLMGMGIPEGQGAEAYLDKALMAVFTALNDKAADLGMAAFEPPTPLSEHPASTHVSALIDNYVTRHIASGDLPHLIPLAKFVFGSSEHFAGVLNHAMDYTRSRTGKPFPPSVDSPVDESDDGHRWNYDGVFNRVIGSIPGIGDMAEDIKSHIINNNLLPDSKYISDCDPTRGPLGPHFNNTIRNLIVDARRALIDKDKKRLDSEASLDLVPDSTSYDIDPKDIQDCFLNFRDFLVQKVGEQDSLIQILDLLLQGKRAKDIKELLGLDPSPYTERLKKIKAFGREFLRVIPKYADLLEPLLYD